MYKGTNASDGIGIGTAVIVEEAELVITRREVGDAQAEVSRFKGALEQTVAETQKMAEDLATRVGEKEAEIMQGHMMLLSDPMLTGEIENSISNDKVNAEFAIETVCNMYADMFASMGDELMQQRATDMRDIKARMQTYSYGASVCRCVLSAGRHCPGGKGSDPFHDGRDQSGQCGWNRYRVRRPHLPQRHPGKSAGDSGCGGRKRSFGAGKGRG